MAPSKVDPGAPDICAAVAQLAADIQTCAAEDWSGGECTILYARLNGCTDPQITDPAPDQEGCHVGKEGTREDFEYAALVACESLVQYGPDGESPCGPRIGAGGPQIDRNSTLYVYSCILMGVCNAADLACASPITQPSQGHSWTAGVPRGFPGRACALRYMRYCSRDLPVQLRGSGGASGAASGWTCAALR